MLTYSLTPRRVSRWWRCLWPLCFAFFRFCAGGVVEEELVLVALLLRLLQLLRRVGGSADGLLVDRDDHVAGLDAALGRRTVRGDLRDDDALDLALEAELLARLPVELA